MKKIALLGMILASSASVAMADLHDVSVGGTFLGGPIGILQENRETKTGKRQQFDFAANIDVEAKLDAEWSVFMQLQASPGAGALGFPGPESALTDVTLTYDPKARNYVVTMGSFDMPFGISVPTLTNNADSFANDYITNDLLYSMFAGPVGTLNTIGVKYDHAFSKGDITLALTNGTDESSQNDDGGFAVLLGAKTTSLIPYATFGASVLSSSEKFTTDPGVQADGVATITNFNSEFMGYILDFDWAMSDKVSIAYYGAFLTYDDHDSTTKDDVTAWMAKVRTNLSEKCYLAVRISGWNPEDSDGSGTGISNALVGKTAGMATLQGTVFPVADQQIIRYDVVYGHQLKKNVLLKAQIFMDDYQKETQAQNTDVLGAMAVANVRF